MRPFAVAHLLFFVTFLAPLRAGTVVIDFEDLPDANFYSDDGLNILTSNRTSRASACRVSAATTTKPIRLTPGM
jgi:hypothetical protein